MQQELRRIRLELRELPSNPLLAHGQRHFSQNDEDGILLEILRRIGIVEPSAFVEFGVGDGTQNNTIILLALGWRGVWVGGENLTFATGARLSFLQHWITKDNAGTLAQEGLAALGLTAQDVRVTSVDLDGNDGPIVRDLLSNGLAPDVFIVEYNAKFPPKIEFEMPYDEKFVWQGDDYFGVSLQRWVRIFSSAGYALVACSETGVNAFFVKTAHMAKFTDIPTDVEQLYMTGDYGQYPRTGHPTSPRTVRYLTGSEIPHEEVPRAGPGNLDRGIGGVSA
jgi:hypothetical protein